MTAAVPKVKMPECVQSIPGRAKKWASDHPVWAALIAADLIKSVGLFAHAKYKRWIRHNTVIEFDFGRLASKLVDFEPSPNPMAKLLGQKQQISFRAVLEALHLVAHDPKIIGVLIRIGSGANTLSFSQIQELRLGLGKIREAGKRVVAFAQCFGELDVPAGTRAWYLAAAADKILMDRCGTVALNGMVAEAPFIKHLLDKCDVDTAVVRRSEFKSFFTMFSHDKMDAGMRTAYQAIVDGLKRQFVADVARDRGIEPRQVEEIMASPTFPGAEEAKQLKLIDEIADEDEVYEQLPRLFTTRNRQQPRLLFLLRYFAKKNSTAFPGLGKKDKIALISTFGNILSGQSQKQQTIGGDTVADEIRNACLDARVRAIVLRIDSPGGSAVASNTIGRAIAAAQRKGIKVVACQSRVAASGGYWMSVACDAIVSMPSVLTGSIGVTTTLLNTRRAWAKLGITWDDVVTDDAAKLLSNLEPVTDRAPIADAKIGEIYALFKRQVADGRQVSIGRAEQLAKGRVWLGDKAHEIGLVDRLGGYVEAVRLAHELVGVNQGSLQVQIFPRPKSLFQKLTASPAENSRQSIQAAKPGAVSGQIDLLSAIDCVEKMAQCSSTVSNLCERLGLKTSQQDTGLVEARCVMLTQSL